MKSKYFATALSLGILLSAACRGSSGDRSSMRLVPSDSVVVMSARWKAVSRDGELKQLIKGEEVERLFAGLKLDGEAVSELAVFSDGQDAQAGSTGMIVSGTFDGREVAARLKGSGWGEQALGGNRIYVNPADGSCLAVVGKSLLVLGARAAVEGALRAGRDPGARFVANPSYRRLAQRMDGGQYPLSVVVAFPQATQDAASTALEVTSLVMDFAGVGPLGDLLNKIGYVRGFGCSFSRRGDALPVELLAIMRDEESARFVSGAITLSKGLASLAPRSNLKPADDEAVRSLQSLSVARDRELLTVRVTMPVASLNGGR